MSILSLLAVKESAMILLQTVPTHIQVKHLQDKLLEKVSMTYFLLPNISIHTNKIM